jgi:hypothetical protein
MFSRDDGQSLSVLHEAFLQTPADSYRRKPLPNESRSGDPPALQMNIQRPCDMFDLGSSGI